MVSPTQQVQEKLKAAGLSLFIAVFLQLPVTEPLQRLGPLEDVAIALGALLELVTVHFVRYSIHRMRV